MMPRTIFAAAALSILGTSNAMAEDKPCPLVMPRYIESVTSTHTLPPYPPESVTAAEQGITQLQVHIGTDGVPITTALIQSSGSDRLDQAAAAHVVAVWRWRWKPDGCTARTFDTLVNIKWDLQNGPPPAP